MIAPPGLERFRGFVRRLSLLAFLAIGVSSLAFAAPEKWAKAIDEFTGTDAKIPALRSDAVFVGSSSIVKWTTLAQDFPGLKVLNRGFGGSELGDSVFYAERIVTPHQPRFVVLYAGDNDLNAGKTPETVHADFQAFVAKVHAKLSRARIVFIAIKPSPSRWEIREKAERANALIAAECAKDERLRFVDIWKPMLDEKGEPRRDLFVADMLHINAAGYAIWTPLVAAELK